jgi:hypothetical protein
MVDQGQRAQLFAEFLLESRIIDGAVKLDLDDHWPVMELLISSQEDCAETAAAQLTDD